MLRATLRKLDTHTVDVKGEGLEAIQALLAEHRPDGFDLVSAPVAMLKGETAITSTGTYARRDETREVEGETMAALREQTPEGWQLLHVVRL